MKSDIYQTQHSTSLTKYNPTSGNTIPARLKSARIGVIGLGYVGLPIADLFSQHFETIGYDINEKRIDALKDSNHFSGRITFTSCREEIAPCNVYIVAVPTPVDRHNNPDIGPLLEACSDMATVLEKGDIVIFESTVYPGMTEEECVPLLEKESGP